jgi:hypothetical protein
MRWLLLVALLTSCAKKSPTKCHAEAVELENFLNSVDRMNVPFEIRAPMTLPVRDDLPEGDRPYADDIKVFRDHWEYLDERYTTIETLEARLVHIHQNQVELGSKHRDASVLYLIVDRAAIWERVVAAFEAAQGAGYTKQLFVFAGSKRQTPPPPSKIDGELDAAFALEAGERGSKLGQIFTRFANQCPAMHKPFVNKGADDGKTRTDELIEDTTKDLVDCNCSVDMPSLRMAMWRLIAEPMQVKIVAIEATPPGKAHSPKVVIAPKLTSWADVSKRIDAKSPQLWLAAEP